MKKRLLTAMLAGVMATTCVMGLAACGDDKGKDEGDAYAPPKVTSADTFIGVESVSGYDSTEKAAKAYFEDELGGEYIAYKSVSALSSDSIKKIGLSDSAVKTATVVEVSFKRVFGSESERAIGVLTSADGSDSAKTLTNTAYVIEYADGTYKYYSPRPNNGESVTKSYFAALTDGKSYVNCKMTETFIRQNYCPANEEPDSSQDESYMRYDDAMTLTVCDDLIEYKTDFKSTDLLRPNNVAEEEKSTSYDVRRGSKIYSCQSPDYEWSDFEADDEWSDYIYKRVFEASWVRYLGQYYHYLEKTDKGFKATDDYYTAFGFKYRTKSRNAYCEVKDGKIVKAVDEYVLDESNKEELYENRCVIESINSVTGIEISSELLQSLEQYIASAPSDLTK